MNSTTNSDLIGRETEQAWARFFGVPCKGGFNDEGVDLVVGKMSIQVKTSTGFALNFWAKSIMYSMQTGRKANLRYLVVGDPPRNGNPAEIIAKLKRDLFWLEPEQAHLRNRMVKVRFELIKHI